jgi:xanthine/CO dehydrogenase XdhC/CoxF family maturation factor
LFLALLGLGCVNASVIQRRAAYDLRCGPIDVDVTEVGGGAFEARCGGTVALYFCKVDEWTGETQCLRERDR